MRYRGLMALAMAVSAAPLAAQDFEGTVALKVNGSPMTWKIKGDKSVATLGQPVAGRAQTRYIIDREAKTTTVLTPLPNGLPFAVNVEGLKMVSEMPDEPTTTDADSSRKITARRLGTTQTIAGFSCDDYELSDSLKTHACLSKTFGSFMMPGRSFGGGGASSAMGFGTGSSVPFTFSNGAMAGQAIRMGDITSAKSGSEVATVGGMSGQVITIPGGNGSTGHVMVMATDSVSSAMGGGVNAVFTTRTATSAGDGTRQTITMGPGGGTITTTDASGHTTTVPFTGNPPAGSMGSLSAMGGMGGMGGMSDGPMVRTITPPAPVWSDGLKDKGFPLKVWIPGGRVILETTSVTRGPISDENFFAPATYVDPAELNALLRQGAGGGL